MPSARQAVVIVVLALFAIWLSKRVPFVARITG